MNTNLREVTGEQFHATVGPLNVHPHIVNRWDDRIGYRSEWLMQDGSRRLIGVSESGVFPIKPRRYWLVTA